MSGDFQKEAERLLVKRDLVITGFANLLGGQFSNFTDAKD